MLLGAINALIAMAVMGGDAERDDHWGKIPEPIRNFVCEAYHDPKEHLIRNLPQHAPA